MKIYQEIASTTEALKNCVKSGNAEQEDKHAETLRKIEKNYLPYGSGFDAGTTINLEKSTSCKIVLQTSFHHMDENGYYDGWTEHNITIRPAFNGIDITISGINKRDIKSYIAETFDYVLNQEYVKGE